MKRILALLATLIPVAFFARRRSESAKAARQPLVVTPPKEYVQPEVQPQSNQRESRLERHKLLVVPYILFAATTIAAIATAWFAWQTNEITNAQWQEVLDRQNEMNEIQASQSLPDFVFIRQVQPMYDGSPLTEWLQVSNQGGLARNVTLDVYPVVSIEWTGTPDAPGGSVQNIPMPNYSSASWGVPQHLTDEVVWISHRHTAHSYTLFEGLLRDAFKEDFPTGSVYVRKEWYIRIAYQDYQGNNRDEMYVLNGQLNDLSEWANGPYMLDAEAAEEFMNDWSDHYERGLIVSNDFSREEVWVDGFVQDIYDLVEVQN